MAYGRKYEDLVNLLLERSINPGGNTNMTTVSIPAVGSRVRYTVEGVVTSHRQQYGRQIVVIKDGKGVCTDIDCTNPGLTYEVLTPVFIPGKRYRSTPAGTHQGVRTTFGKWAVTVHPNPAMVGEVLTDEKFFQPSSPQVLNQLLKSMYLVD